MMANRPGAKAVPGFKKQGRVNPILPALELRFSKSVCELVEGLMDLNVPAPELEQAWVELSNLRNMLLDADGMVITKPVPPRQNPAADLALPM